MKAIMGSGASAMVSSLLAYTVITLGVLLHTMLMQNDVFSNEAKVLITILGSLTWFMIVCLHLATALSDPGFVAYVENDVARDQKLKKFDPSNHEYLNCEVIVAVVVTTAKLTFVTGVMCNKRGELVIAAHAIDAVGIMITIACFHRAGKMFCSLKSKSTHICRSGLLLFMNNHQHWERRHRFL